MDRDPYQSPESSAPLLSEENVNLFKSSFKKFKSFKNPQKLVSGGESEQNFNKTSSNTSLEDAGEILLDPTNGECGGTVAEWDAILQERCLCFDKNVCSFAEKVKKLGLRCPSTWKVYDLQFPKGLILIRNPFTPEGQRFWISRSVIDFPKPPYITNIDNLENKEGKSIKDKLNCDEFYKKLRWVTFGYHHNWDTKVYSEDSKCEFPPDLADLTKCMAEVLRFPDFKAEASIANYYHLDSTLSGHVDKSEANQEAPLFSLSFGQSAVFLIGGRSKTVKPQAIHLRSGDVAIMSGESRSAYHGVPKVFKAENEPWNKCETFSFRNSIESEVSKKRIRLDDGEENGPTEIDTNVEWTDFLANYASKSRINLNIRQVLFPGHTELCQSWTKISK